MRFRVLILWVIAVVFEAVTFGQNSTNEQGKSSLGAAHSNERDWSFSSWIERGKRTRNHWADLGITGGLTLTGDFTTELRGGTPAPSAFARCLFDVSVGIDGQKLAGWSGGSALFRLHSYQGENGRDYVEDVQGFSNIDDDATTKIYEMWVEQKVPDTNWRARVGKIDANTLFATVENGSDFMNSSMGYSPTIFKLPTYPDPHLSANVLYDDGRRALGVGLYATDDSGSLWLLEGSKRFSFANDSRFRTVLGVWQLRGNVISHAGVAEGRTTGIYLVEEVSLRRKSANAEQRPFAAFFQYGRADARVSPFGNHFGFGIVGPGLSRAGKDSIGIGISTVTLSRDPEMVFDYDFETAFEVFYKFRLNSMFSLSPDVQFIRHPGGIEGREDAVVFTPRLVAVF